MAATFVRRVEADGRVAWRKTYADGGTRRIRLASDQAAAETLDGERQFGEGVLSSTLINDAGFDRVSLRADESIQFNAGVNLRAGEGRARLQSVVLDAPVLDLNSAADALQADERVQPDHVIEAHHVAMGPVTRQNANAATPASERTLTGDRWLRVQAGLIEINGDTAVQGANQVDLWATLGRSTETRLDRRDGEIRFIGQRPLAAGISDDRSLRGQFGFQGELNLRAGQVYATTLSQVTVAGQGTDSRLTLSAPEGGSTAQTPLSALARNSMSSIIRAMRLRSSRLA